MALRFRCSASSTAQTVVPLLAAQDFKRVGEGDTGPNTGGMGAYAPVPWLPDDVYREIVSQIVEPVAAELVARGSPFSGLLYVGLAITSNGPAVVEFNCRFGDPETQAVLALLDSPLGQLLHAAGTGKLADFRRVALAGRRGRDGGAGGRELSRASPGRVTSSPAPKPTASCMREQPDATTVRSSLPAAGCCRWWVPVPISPRHERRLTQHLRSIRLPGSHFRN